ncbi:pentapeptide repeat-containing protein [Chryseobacterium sp. R2ACT005]|uniref:pentapeptide repeat-containing protein n=1 Tax=Chryseobacterium sp. R2ACT005 TaxID=3416668 RepID=UPI003CF84913
MNTKMIGSKITEARKKLSMSQAELAKHVFVSPQAVGKWERGESLPDIITLNQLTKILDVDLNYFSEYLQSRDEAVHKIDGNATTEADQIIQRSTDASGIREPELLINFSGSNLAKSDFAGVIAHKRKFYGSSLSESDFSGADLVGSTFTGNDMRKANFDGANLTDCVLSVSDLSESSFNETILVRTEFNKSGLTQAKFNNAKLTNVKLIKTDLTKTMFENCVFEGVDFDYSDLRGVSFDGQTFLGVKFHNGALNEVTFIGATLKNVSFRSTFALTNRYYRAIKTIRFDGAMMDKLTYAALKGIGADLSKVTMI